MPFFVLVLGFVTSWMVSKTKTPPSSFWTVCTREVGNRRNRLLAFVGDPSARFSVAVLANGRPMHEVRLGLVIEAVSWSAAKISECVIVPQW